MNKATCLNLLAHAVLVWNTVHMMRIIQQRRASGETMTEEELARISPMAFSHVIPNGTYFARRISLEQEGDHHAQVPPYRHGDRIRRLAAERDLAEALPYIFRRLLLEPRFGADFAVLIGSEGQSSSIVCPPIFYTDLNGLLGIVNLLSGFPNSRLVCPTRHMSTPPTNHYKHHRFPAEIISHIMWLYVRFCLSYRDVEELFFARGVIVTYEAIRKWCVKFGQHYANQLRR